MNDVIVLPAAFRLVTYGVYQQIQIPSFPFSEAHPLFIQSLELASNHSYKLKWQAALQSPEIMERERPLLRDLQGECELSEASLESLNQLTSK